MTSKNQDASFFVAHKKSFGVSYQGTEFSKAHRVDHFRGLFAPIFKKGMLIGNVFGALEMVF